MRGDSPLPVLIAGVNHALWVSAEGEVETLEAGEVAARLEAEWTLLCHRKATARRLGLPAMASLDILELFAFVHPARPCLPTPVGVATAVGETAPPSALSAEAAMALLRARDRLLATLAAPDYPGGDVAAGVAWQMGQAGWPWAPAVLSALGRPDGGTRRDLALRPWLRLSEWQETPPPPPPAGKSLDAASVRERLDQLLTRPRPDNPRQGHGAGTAPGEGVNSVGGLASGGGREPRPDQSAYAAALTPAFAPREAPGAPNVVLAQAGTGIGKTLGYLAPATLWAERNGAPVWISTYTRNLQHQIDDELERLVADPSEKRRRIVMRKGRENYLCLLNLEEQARGVQTSQDRAVAMGLMCRWAEATRDGDLGGDLPAWLIDLLGRGNTLGLADRRGECIYSACPHYQKCFIEGAVRRARQADVVVANHALVMVQAALGGVDDTHLPTRYVFDEGHHLFDAADSAFSSALSGQETAELRRWLIGREQGARTRARGLRQRLEDLLAGDAEAWEALETILGAARALPGEGWGGRVMPDLDAAPSPGAGASEAPDPGRDLAGDEATVDPRYHPSGPAERFLAAVHWHVHARAPGRESPYSLEAPVEEPASGLLAAAQALDQALARLKAPLVTLRQHLRRRLEEEGDTLDSGTRVRIEAACRSLHRRGDVQIEAWRSMLSSLHRPTPPEFVDWFQIDRVDGRERDVGLHRHYIDPSQPFSAVFADQAHGLVVTSATLRDGSGDDAADWQAAEARTGAAHMPKPAVRAHFASPFDYAGQTRVIIVRDVRKDDLGQVAGAYRALFEAAGGGALGLFTAIQRLRAVYERIHSPLAATGFPLYAQHIDGLDVASLIDVFRAEIDSCLLGTDAVRDGVDVPGRALRAIVFDRVPWPRPSLLYRARKEAFGKGRYTDMLTRLRLAQAYGRLVRRREDHGVFILLDPMMPSRLTGAFPEGVEVHRCGLAEAVSLTRDFLRPDPAPA